MQSASEFLTFVVSSLVDSKELIEITEREDELGTLLTLKVAKEDMGTIIGKEGKTIQAIRTVLRVHGSKTDKRVNLKIIEE
ncbi:MAG: KH domain-containing protein [Patescibacteria group bacterium]